jgi:multimeric flavodoxin WrbA
MVKITLINGSPRKKRSCNFLIDQAIEGIKSVSEEFEINKIQISEFNITPCNGCDQCLRPPNDCPLAEGDDTKKIEDIIMGSSAILIAAPNYFGSVSSQIKVLIDRSRPWKMKNYLLKDTIFAPMAATGLRNGGAGVVSDLINFALIQGMIIVGNTMGSPVLEGNIPITSLQKFGMKEFVGKGETDELAGKVALDIGKRVAELLNKIRK